MPLTPQRPNRAHGAAHLKAFRAGRLGTALGATLALATLLAGCAVPALHIDTQHTAQSQGSRVQQIVLHYTAGNFASSLKTLTQGPVSSHYLVAQDPPTVYRLVNEDRRAFHAGVSSWLGQSGLNGTSIGIEIVNAGPLAGWRRDQGAPLREADWQPFPPEQVAVVIALVRDIAQRHGVKPHQIVGHSDIAPSRKMDPGPLFPWPQLHAAGLVPWPDERQVQTLLADWQRAADEGRPDQAAPTDAAWFQQRLARLGHAVPNHGQWDNATRDVLIAFQTRYRPRLFNGRPDAETAALLQVATTPGGLLMVQPDGQRVAYRP